jgi:ABC-2 type transport system ATP-binding protein
VPAIQVEGLSKSYGTVQAVAEVSFEVENGEVFALLGPNGAGKTTTVEILEGFRHRDRGRVRVLDTDPDNSAHNRRFRQRIGIVLQELAVEPYLSVREVLQRNAGYYPHPRSVDEVIELVGLTEKTNARVKTLSGGQQRRLDVGLGIVGDPELVFLDEPTTGFDPSARRGAWDLIRSLSGTGTTVLLTTHYMDEAEALANRVAIMAGGSIVAEGAPDTLGGRDVGDAWIRFRLPAGCSPAELPVPATVTEPGSIEIQTNDTVKMLHELTGWALDHHVELLGLSVERLTLEDVYLRLTSNADDATTRPIP